MSEAPVMSVSPETAADLIEDVRRSLPMHIQQALRQFWLERLDARGLVPTPRDRIMGFTSAGAMHSHDLMMERFGEGSRH